MEARPPLQTGAGPDRADSKEDRERPADRARQEHAAGRLSDRVPLDLPAASSIMLARAKINLYLHVIGRRADGFHLLDSLVVFAETGDEIAVAPAVDLSLTITGPFAG